MSNKRLSIPLLDLKIEQLCQDGSAEYLLIAVCHGLMESQQIEVGKDLGGQMALV